MSVVIDTLVKAPRLSDGNVKLSYSELQHIPHERSRSLRIVWYTLMHSNWKSESPWYAPAESMSYLSEIASQNSASL